MTIYDCARCGHRGNAERFQRSLHTGRRYCLDNPACERRHAKLKRQGKVERGFAT